MGRALLSFRRAVRIMRGSRPRQLISTGAALTVPYMLAAKMSGIPVTYVESATRLRGPSQTGRIAQRIPGTTLLHQSGTWDREGWSSLGSVFDAYRARDRVAAPVQSILVTVGTEQFPFPRALEAVLTAGSELRVTWQSGNTSVRGLSISGEARAWWRADELARRAKTVDAVVTHAGVGSILMSLRAGSCPVVLPRLAALGEHVDDHQSELARVLEDRGLVVVMNPGDDIALCLRIAASREIVRVGVEV